MPCVTVTKNGTRTIHARGAPWSISTWWRLFGAAGCVVGLLAGFSAYGGGWVQDPGEVYVKIWNRTLVGSRAIVGPSTSIALGDRYQDHQLQIYGEVGLLERVTWVGYAAPIGLAVFEDERAVYVGPVDLGARFELVHSESIVLSTQGTIRWRPPVGDTPLFVDDINGERLVIQPTRTTGGAAVELQAGWGFRKGWLSIDVGVEGFTSADFNPAVFARAQVGWKPNQRWVFDLHIPVHHSVGPLVETDVFGVTNTRYLGFGLTGSHWFTKSFGVTASFEGVAVAWSNAGTPSLNLGIEIR